MSKRNPARASSTQHLVLARIVASDGDGSVMLDLGASRVRATVDECVHPTIIATALAAKERVLALEDAESSTFTVVGALRTQPTPGVDPASEYVIRAGRVRIEATDEFTVVSGLSSIAVRAFGHVETLADQITSRAATVHKVVGRMLHLN